MFTLIDSDTDFMAYEHLGYRVEVVEIRGKKKYSVSIAESDKMLYLPKLTYCGEEFIVNPPSLKDDRIDEIIAGLETAKQFIADFRDNKDEL